MSVDFQQIQQQVGDLGADAVQTEARLKNIRKLAHELLNEPDRDLSALRRKVQLAAEFDPNLRCALPRLDADRPLAARNPLPEIPAQGSVIAADGSQINPDRHAEVDYGLINVGAIQMELGSSAAPKTFIESHLIYGREFYEGGRSLTVNTVALKRDLSERKMLAALGEQALAAPVITFTDGPLELWGSKDTDTQSVFQNILREYHEILRRLHGNGVITAGYVDRPGANLIVRLLEIAMLTEEQLDNLRETHPLEGVTDLELFAGLLGPGERSEVFAIQSTSARQYQDALSLYFFYLNVSTYEPKLARIEIPGWVAENPARTDALQATLYRQCQLLGGRSYPYLLHRAHEVAVVTRDESDQVTNMIQLELRRRGLEGGEKSPKQSLKDMRGKRRFKV
ncbi:MAG: DNA double-strand break repair nuclease NurA [Anaerolineales bacterium]